MAHDGHPCCPKEANPKIPAHGAREPSKSDAKPVKHNPHPSNKPIHT